MRSILSMELKEVRNRLNGDDPAGTHDADTAGPTVTGDHTAGGQPSHFLVTKFFRNIFSNSF